jgi:hypothetical protein
MLLVAGLVVPFAVFGLESGASAARAELDASQDLVAPVLPAHTTLPTAIAFLQRSLALRVSTLSTLSRKVAAAKTLAVADKVTLVAELSSTSSAMAALQAKAPNEPTLATTRTDLGTMVLDYHVLSFIDPQVLAVIAADADLAKANQLLSQEAAIRAAINAAGDAHENVAREKVLMETFTMRLSALQAAVTGLSTTLLALQPSSVPASLSTLSAAALSESRADLDAAAASAAEQRIVTLLAQPASHLKLAKLLQQG